MSIHRRKNSRKHKEGRGFVCVQTSETLISDEEIRRLTKSFDSSLIGQLPRARTLKQPRNYCVYVIPPPKTVPKKDRKGPFSTREWVELGTAVRKRLVESDGRIDDVLYEPYGSYQGSPYNYKYSTGYAVQSQTVTEEWASPILRGRQEWHPFQHYKRSLGGYAPPPYKYGHRFYAPDHDDIGNLFHSGIHTDPFWLFTLDGSEFGKYSPEKDLPELVLRETGDAEFIPYPSQIAGLTEAALNSMLPRIRAELSGVNSLIELTDFLHFPAALARMSNVIGKSLSGEFRHLRSLYNNYGTLGNMAKELGGNFLQWKFFIQPFISDVQSVMKALQGTHDRILRLLRASEKGQLRHYSRVFNEFDKVDPTVFAGTIFHGPDLTRIEVNRTVSMAPSEFHAEIDYTYSYSQFQVEFAQLLGLLDAFGVNLNPATIWRAIPFSFVVDWFVNVGRWLDRLKLRNMEPVINIRRYCWSIKRSRRIDCRISRFSANYPPSGAAFAPNLSTYLPSLYETSFGRWTTMPDRTSIESSSLDSEEFKLGTALLLSRRRVRSRSNARSRIAQVTNRRH
jgi:hypothetical protein